MDADVISDSNDAADLERLRNKKLIYRGSKLCMTSDLGVHGNLFGGKMMSLIDENAGIFVCEICDTPRMVTKKIEEVVFDRPVKVGSIMKIYCGIEKIGSTSITIRVEVRNYNVYTEKEYKVCSTRLVFVRIDEEGNAIPIADRIKIKFGLKD